MDGNTHSLSTRYSTLTAAQAVCPDATALTQQIDWCAWDAAYTYIKNNYDIATGTFNKKMLVPNGTLYTTSPLPLTCLSDPNPLTNNIASISNNAGLIQVTLASGNSHIVTGHENMVISGAAANTGANGTWTVTLLDYPTNENFTLNGSTYTNPQSTQQGTAGFQDGCGATGTTRGLFTVEFDGEISCHATGGNCIEGFGSRFVELLRPKIYGSCGADEPAIAIAHGRTVAYVGSDEWHISGGRTNGCFSFTSYYNLASENTRMEGNSLFQNIDNNGSAWAGVLDGGNFWQLTPTFVSIGIPQLTPNSFNGFHGVGVNFYPSAGNSRGLWIYGTRAADFQNSYVVSQASGPCITLYNDSTGAPGSFAQMLRADIHCEPGAGITSTFSVVSAVANSSPALQGFTFSDPGEYATISIFALGTNTASAYLQDSSVLVTSIVTNLLPLFDTSANWTVNRPDRIYIASTDSPSLKPTVGEGCSGVGTGGSAGCGLNTGGTVTQGRISVIAGTSGTASTGTVQMTFPFNMGPNRAVCTASLANSSEAWNALATVQTSANAQTTVNFNWFNNSVNLTASGSYAIHYTCNAE